MRATCPFEGKLALGIDIEASVEENLDNVIAASVYSCLECTPTSSTLHCHVGTVLKQKHHYLCVTSLCSFVERIAVEVFLSL
jgi:hypothetical protein